MKRFLTSLLAVVVMLTASCAHKEPTLSEELAKEDLGKTEVVNSAPSQETVAASPLGEAGQPAFAPPIPVTPQAAPEKFVTKVEKRKKTFVAKSKRKHRKSKMLAKKARRKHKRASPNY